MAEFDPDKFSVPSFRSICEMTEGRKLTDEEFKKYQDAALMTLDSIELMVSDSEDIHKELET